MKRRRMFALVATGVLGLMLLGVLARPASAHRGDQSYLYLDVTQTSLGGRIEAPIRDLNQGLGLDLAGSDEEISAQLAANLDLLYAYFEGHLEIGGEGSTWPIEFRGADLFFSDLPEADDNYVVFPFTVTVDEDVPRQLEVRFDPFFDEIEGRDALLLIGNDWQGGVIDNGSTVLTAYDGSTRSQLIDLGDTSRFGNFKESGKLGVNHIRTGPDHILFVFVLLLPAVLVFTSGWQPAKSFRASLWRVLKIVTMFTVAHSITFTAAGLDLLPLPSSRIVESVIAISIAAAALHNIRPIAANKEWMIAFAFGLFHGMGFALLVSGLDVDRSTQLISLLGRNVGIEIGQAVVVLLVFPGLFLLRRTRYFRGFFLTVSALMVAVSLGWLVERLLDVDLGVSGLVEPLVDWPSVLVYVVVFTVVAAAVRWLERINDRLVPVDTSGASHDRLQSTDELAAIP